MGTKQGKHAAATARSSRTTAIYLTISLSVAVVAVAAAVVVRALDGGPDGGSAAPQPAAHTAPAVPAASDQTIVQEGTIVAVTPTSVTAVGADGVARTYLVDGQTNAITSDGSRVGAAVTAFAVDDPVSIVGVVRNGAPVATAVAHRDVTGLGGPPMDYALP